MFANPECFRLILYLIEIELSQEKKVREWIISRSSRYSLASLMKTFNFSSSAFKRLIGSLHKEKLEGKKPGHYTILFILNI